MFITLPKVFDSIGGTACDIIGALFFLLVLFAALTSSISLMDTVVSIIRDKFGDDRRTKLGFDDDDMEGGDIFGGTIIGSGKLGKFYT